MEDKNNLEKRMYIFVLYSLKGIQMGIQAGHAVEQYAYNFGQDPAYRSYVEAHKTWIILNGGPTNNQFVESEPGHLGNIKYVLEELEYEFATFEEPDLNNALTAVCFLASEPVFNYNDYPDLDKFAKSQMPEETSKWASIFRNGSWSYDDVSMQLPEVYIKWSEMMKGHENIALRQLLKGKKLA